jgi:transposase-like protein
VSVASVARRHGMNDNMIFTWCKRFRDEGVDLLPVMVSP